MPYRDITFINGGIYHIFNKTIDARKLFDNQTLGQTFLKIIEYYRSNKTHLCYADYKKLPEEKRTIVWENIHCASYFQIHLLAYCFMPNHFHLLVKQKQELGVQKFMAKILNSFTRYFNIKFHRKGPLFLPQFKAVTVISDEQLMHVSRYIHLNPLSSKIISSKVDLPYFPFSSYLYYISNKNTSLINTDKVLRLFDNNKKNYEKFVLQHADYQQKIEYLKHTHEWT